LAPSFNEYSPGQFFYIGLPDIGGGLFAHSEVYGGGYNFTSGTFNVSMAPGSLIFDGPTSAPVWRDGVYTDVANYFQPGANLGTVRLTINTESVPIPSLFSLFGLSIIVLMIRKFKK
jgi:hypothetical protein